MTRATGMVLWGRHTLWISLTSFRTIGSAVRDRTGCHKGRHQPQRYNDMPDDLPQAQCKRSAGGRLLIISLTKRCGRELTLCLLTHAQILT